MSRCLWCMAALPLLVVGCRYVPLEAAKPLSTAVVEVKSPSVVDYPLAAAAEHLRRADELTTQLAALRASIAESELHEAQIRERITYLREHAVMLPIVREAHEYFYRGKLGAVRSTILTSKKLTSNLAQGKGYELNRAYLCRRRAGLMLKGYIPEPER